MSFWDNGEYCVKHTLSMGVEITVRGWASGLGPHGSGCPVHVTYLDGNNSKFGAYPREVRVTAVGDYPLKYVGCGSGSLVDPYTDAPGLRICAWGKFPRHLHLRVDRQPWTLMLQEDRKEAEPSLRERWLHHCQTVQPVPFLDYPFVPNDYALPQHQSPDHGHIMSSMATGMAYDPGFAIHAWGSHLQHAAPPPYPHPTPAPTPPPPKPKPDIFKLGKQPRRIEGGP